MRRLLHLAGHTQAGSSLHIFGHNRIENRQWKLKLHTVFAVARVHLLFRQFVVVWYLPVMQQPKD